MADAPATPLIALDRVVLRRDGKAILNGLSLQADQRRIGIVGRNGSGKTTLARLLAGLIEADEGSVTLAGMDVARDRKAALTTVGILFQNPEHQIIFPTVAEELSFGLTQMGQSRQNARAAALDVLARFGKTHWADAAIHTLSQGQKHLVCLMAVVAMNPKVLILDEPFAGLDLPTRLQLTRYLALYQGSLVHITHDPSDIADYDRAIWLDRGAIAADGPAAQVLSDYTAAMRVEGEGDDISDLAG